MGKLISDGYKQFIRETDQACKEFPKLIKVTREDGKLILRGELDIIDKDGKFWESYTVEVHHSDDFPFRFPILYEVGGKLPRIGDWHIYEDSGACCITVPPDEILICKKGISLSHFIHNEALPYLFNQTHRRVEGYYKNGEYQHGVAGITQFYDDVLTSNGDIRQVIQMMMFIAKGQRPGRTHICFCGAKEKFRRCHRQAFDKLTGVGRIGLLRHAFLIAGASGQQDLMEKIGRELIQLKPTPATSVASW
jgi:hypothetical protein